MVDEIEFDHEPTHIELLDTLESEDHALIDGEYIVRQDLIVADDDRGYVVRLRKPDAYGESAIWLLRRENEIQ